MTTVTTPVSSGFARWGGAILGGLTFLTVVYGVTYSLVVGDASTSSERMCDSSVYHISLDLTFLLKFYLFARVHTFDRLTSSVRRQRMNRRAPAPTCLPSKCLPPLCKSLWG